MSGYPRLVSWSYYSGQSRLSSRTSKENLQKVYITDPAGESLLKDGQVACLARDGISLLGEDPYFKVVNKVGYTPRARKHRDMEREMSESYPELKNKLKGFDSKLRDYNDYVYVDLAYINNYVNPIVKTNPSFHTKNFIKKENFNKDFIIELIEYKPQAAMGGTITSYITKEMPKFMSELKIKFPDLYREVLEESSWLKGISFELSLVGKKAKLASLSAGFVEVEEDILNNVRYYWDKETLTSSKELRSGAIINKEIKPTEDMVVKICDDSVVNKDTELVE